MTDGRAGTTRGAMPRWLRAAGWIAGVALTLLLGAVAGLSFAVARVAGELPAYEAMKVAPTGRTVRIRDARGEVMETTGPAYGEWLPHDRIPSVMRDAMIAVEDRRYDTHWGVDPRALARVVWLAWERRGSDRRLQGASTITQQAARTVFLSQRYDVRRKLKEMVIALVMERRLDKRRILELYLNRVYLGGGAWGVDAASRRFFGHPATSLTTAEAALIAGLARAPSDYAPSADRDAAYARMRVVLGTMRETGRGDAREVAAAAAMEPAFAEAQEPQGNGARYFTDWIKPQVDAIVGGRVGPVDVWTTFDPALQAAADDAVGRGVPEGAQGALVSVDEDGAVRAMVGGTDYQTSSYNRATQALRQPGSAFKLFVYLAALENGYRPTSTVLDAPITIAGWSPRNASGGHMGSVSLATAFAQSLNTVAARLGQNVGIENVARVARRFGFSTRINIDPATVLGTSEARVIDMTRAFASVASGGLAVAPYGIARIEVAGRETYRHRQATQLLTPPQVAADMNVMLRGAVENGTGAAAAIGRPVAGKTGTTSSNKDGWFLGSSSGVTTGVWVGRDDARPIPSLQGGRAPARIFAAYMAKAVRGRPADDGPVVVEEGSAAADADDAATTTGGTAKGAAGAATTNGNAPSPNAGDEAESENEGENDETPRAPVRRAPADGRSRAVPEEF